MALGEDSTLADSVAMEALSLDAPTSADSNFWQPSNTVADNKIIFVFIGCVVCSIYETTRFVLLIYKKFNYMYYSESFILK